MCCLSGLETSMMTGQIADAFERTPLYPPNVRVKWVEESETYHLPVVKMTIFEEQDVCTLLKEYGRPVFQEVTSDSGKVERLKFQRQQLDILRRKHYIP